MRISCVFNPDLSARLVFSTTVTNTACSCSKTAHRIAVIATLGLSRQQSSTGVDSILVATQIRTAIRYVRIISIIPGSIANVGGFTDSIILASWRRCGLIFRGLIFSGLVTDWLFRSGCSRRRVFSDRGFHCRMGFSRIDRRCIGCPCFGCRLLCAFAAAWQRCQRDAQDT